MTLEVTPTSPDRISHQDEYLSLPQSPDRDLQSPNSSPSISDVGSNRPSPHGDLFWKRNRPVLSKLADIHSKLQFDEDDNLRASYDFDLSSMMFEEPESRIESEIEPTCINASTEPQAPTDATPVVVAPITSWAYDQCVMYSAHHELLKTTSYPDSLLYIETLGGIAWSYEDFSRKLTGIPEHEARHLFRIFTKPPEPGNTLLDAEFVSRTNPFRLAILTDNPLHIWDRLIYLKASTPSITSSSQSRESVTVDQLREFGKTQGIFEDPEIWFRAVQTVLQLKYGNFYANQSGISKTDFLAFISVTQEDLKNCPLRKLRDCFSALHLSLPGHQPATQPANLSPHAVVYEPLTRSAVSKITGLPIQSADTLFCLLNAGNFFGSNIPTWTVKLWMDGCLPGQLLVQALNLKPNESKGGLLKPPCKQYIITMSDQYELEEEEGVKVAREISQDSQIPVKTVLFVLKNSMIWKFVVGSNTLYLKDIIHVLDEYRLTYSKNAGNFFLTKDQEAFAVKHLNEIDELLKEEDGTCLVEAILDSGNHREFSNPDNPLESPGQAVIEMIVNSIIPELGFVYSKYESDILKKFLDIQGTGFIRLDELITMISKSCPPHEQHVLVELSSLHTRRQSDISYLSLGRHSPEPLTNLPEISAHPDHNFNSERPSKKDSIEAYFRISKKLELCGNIFFDNELDGVNEFLNRLIKSGVFPSQNLNHQDRKDFLLIVEMFTEPPGIVETWKFVRLLNFTLFRKTLSNLFFERNMEIGSLMRNQGIKESFDQAPQWLKTHGPSTLKDVVEEWIQNSLPKQRKAAIVLSRLFDLITSTLIVGDKKPGMICLEDFRKILSFMGLQLNLQNTDMMITCFFFSVEESGNKFVTKLTKQQFIGRLVCLTADVLSDESLVRKLLIFGSKLNQQGILWAPKLRPSDSEGVVHHALETLATTRQGEESAESKPATTSDDPIIQDCQSARSVFLGHSDGSFDFTHATRSTFLECLPCLKVSAIPLNLARERIADQAAGRSPSAPFQAVIDNLHLRKLLSEKIPRVNFLACTLRVQSVVVEEPVQTKLRFARVGWFNRHLNRWVGVTNDLSAKTYMSDMTQPNHMIQNPANNSVWSEWRFGKDPCVVQFPLMHINDIEIVFLVEFICGVKMCGCTKSPFDDSPEEDPRVTTKCRLCKTEYFQVTIAEVEITRHHLFSEFGIHRQLLVNKPDGSSMRVQKKPQTRLHAAANLTKVLSRKLNSFLMEHVVGVKRRPKQVKDYYADNFEPKEDPNTEPGFVSISIEEPSFEGRLIPRASESLLCASLSCLSTINRMRVIMSVSDGLLKRGHGAGDALTANREKLINDLQRLIWVLGDRVDRIHFQDRVFKFCGRKKIHEVPHEILFACL